MISKELYYNLGDLVPLWLNYYLYSDFTKLHDSYPNCFRTITYLDVTPSILFFCIAETTTALKRCADIGAWMMWVCCWAFFAADLRRL